MKSFTTLFALFVLILSGLHAQAEADLSKIRMGEHVTGPEISERDLGGRIVVVEYWGVNCPPCIGQIPHISKLAEEYGHERLVIIASHRQNASIDQIKQTWESRAKSNHVVVQQQTTVPGFEVRGIPAAIMFDQTGQEIWRGHPGQIDKPLQEAIQRFRPLTPEKQEAPKAEPIVTGLEAKYFERELEQINEQDRHFETALTKIRRAIDRATREDQVAEGKAILDAVGAWAVKLKAEAEAARASDPTQAYTIAEGAVALLGSDEAGKDLVQMVSEMEADSALMDTIRSTRMLREVKALAEQVGLTKDPAAVDQRAHAKDLRTIARDLRRIGKAWPQTEAGKEAEALLKNWGLDG